MSVNWFGKWLNLYFDYKGWSREDINSNGVRKFKINGHLEDDKIEEENNEKSSNELISLDNNEPFHNLIYFDLIKMNILIHKNSSFKLT